VEAPVDGELAPTSLPRLERVRLAAAEAADWLSHQLEQPVRLGWLEDPRRRTVAADHGGLPGDYLNLSDEAPLLLTTHASLRQLNQWVAQTAGERAEEPAQPIGMARFRPSIVVDGPDGPFAEDDWGGVRVGPVEFRFGEHCDRCVVPTIDPLTGVAGQEPLRTLARYRQWDHKTWFGVRIIPSTTGVIRAGDPVTPVQTGTRSGVRDLA
jgi:uncharacterized protein YcbX